MKELNVRMYQRTRRIATPNDPRDQGILDTLFAYHDKLKKSLYATARDRIHHSELYLNVMRTSTEDTEVRYYWVDHSTCQIFWVEDIRCSALGLPELDSEADIKSRLTPEYWTHVEYFPMHLPVKQEVEDAITGILRHGCVDNMTSPGSTFPFSEVECRQYLEVFDGFKCPYEGHSLSTAQKSLHTVWLLASNAVAAQGYRNAVIGAIPLTSTFLARVGVDVFSFPS
ncbi:hypothetical protein FRB94_012464 [Tulasnella sp. JGI-2019a]|nr:hypothetical protein FRB94_012464 [Tulasnella sp. JGI-2019a]